VEIGPFIDVFCLCVAPSPKAISEKAPGGGLAVSVNQLGKSIFSFQGGRNGFGVLHEGAYCFQVLS